MRGALGEGKTAARGLRHTAFPQLIAFPPHRGRHGGWPSDARCAAVSRRRASMRERSNLSRPSSSRIWSWQASEMAVNQTCSNGCNVTHIDVWVYMAETATTCSAHLQPIRGRERFMSVAARRRQDDTLHTKRAVQSSPRTHTHLLAGPRARVAPVRWEVVIVLLHAGHTGTLAALLRVGQQPEDVVQSVSYTTVFRSCVKHRVASDTLTRMTSMQAPSPPSSVSACISYIGMRYVRALMSCRPWPRRAAPPPPRRRR